MEFKDKLKKLRKEKGISQQALSEAIFVSRSAVAKWENGLGLPCEESLNGLCDYFGVTKDFWATEEPEAIIIEKNKKISKLKKLVILSVAIILLTFYAVVFMDIFSQSYSITLDGAAGTFADNDCIETGDYYIYYYTMGGESGSEYEYIADFTAVKKLFIGYTDTNSQDIDYKVLYVNDEKVGVIWSLKGENGYYNIIRPINYIGTVTPWFEYFSGIKKVKVNGREYDVTHNSFFISDEPVEEFYIGDVRLVVGGSYLEIE